MNTKPQYGILASDLIEMIRSEYKEDEVVGFSVYGKSDVELDLHEKMTDDQWQTFLKEFVEDEMLNEQRAMAWMQALDVVRQEIEIEE
jgi:hypothetical protein